MKAPALLQKILEDYDAKRELSNWRGVVFARFLFDHNGVHLEHWSVELPAMKKASARARVV
jgi:hypothetical protein